VSTDLQPSRARSSAQPAPRHLVRRFARRGAYQDTKLLLVLVALLAAIIAAVAVWPDGMPITTLMVPLLLSSLLLNPRLLPWFVLFVMVALFVSLPLQNSLSGKTYGSVGIQVLMCLIVLAASLRRSRLGVAGAMGESMFVDLRDRILQQGGVPALPPGWYADSALRSAGGSPFAGDFVVATLADPTRLELAVVDVSGKGEEAGTRALLLSGAFGGLLGALPPDQFLPAANDYLLRQEWEEGFATAIHLSLDLEDGSFEVRSAGHPPAALRQAGTGKWSVLTSEGPFLGLIPDAVFLVATGRIAHLDALLLYTDGMVEEPRRDIDLGIDRMLGEAEHLLRGSFEGAARRLVDALGSRDDDRAMVVVSRSQASSR
jgi:Stage II sporulation protein E (SpoIIE)